HSLEEQSQASSWNKLPEKEANDLDSVVLTMLGTLFPVFRYSSSRLAYFLVFCCNTQTKKATEKRSR
ncbi:MAG: hypothetical protein SFU25_07515, partial [Candidatus Caenarcaniphilales bacterium]|nr:hypothetical protein [Candidatus Caenarcaniphilales bacterium]